MFRAISILTIGLFCLTLMNGCVAYPPYSGYDSGYGYGYGGDYHHGHHGHHRRHGHHDDD